MRKSRYSETQIIQILKRGEAGVPATELCREYGMSAATYYKWRAKYGGMEVSEAKRLRELEEEIVRLKQMYASLSLDHQILKELLEKNG